MAIIIIAIIIQTIVVALEEEEPAADCEAATAAAATCAFVAVATWPFMVVTGVRSVVVALGAVLAAGTIFGATTAATIVASAPVPVIALWLVFSKALEPLPIDIGALPEFFAVNVIVPNGVSEVIPPVYPAVLIRTPFVLSIESYPG